ncbi:MAG: ribbon-helix-helix domain-containing protein [Opitutales bacterium]
MKKKKSHARAPGQTQISISIPQELVDQVEKLAKAENRNRSNFISYQLEKMSKSSSQR